MGPRSTATPTAHTLRRPALGASVASGETAWSSWRERCSFGLSGRGFDERGREEGAGDTRSVYEREGGVHQVHQERGGSLLRGSTLRDGGSAQRGGGRHSGGGAPESI